MPSFTLGIDVGGTSIKCAAISPTGSAIGERRVATPQGDRSGGRTVALLSGLVSDFVDSYGVTAVGVAVPGIVDEAAGTVIDAVNLGWRQLPLRGVLATAIDLPLVFAQDVRTGAYAEASRGAASGHVGVSVFLPIGTGIAAGIIVDGRPLASGGWAGEVGQIEVSATPGRLGLPGRRLEQVASASAIARRSGCANALEAVALVRRGDPRAVAVWDDAIAALAEALAWATAVLGADLIVIGGGLAGADRLLFDPLEEQLRARLGVLRAPRVVAADYGDRAAMIGAGLLAHRDHDPVDPVDEMAASERALG